MNEKKPNRSMKYVSDLNVTCSIQVRNLGREGHAASDNCNAHANTAVEMPDGKLVYRCPRHRGERWLDGADHPYKATARRTGKVHTKVLR